MPSVWSATGSRALASPPVSGPPTRSRATRIVRPASGSGPAKLPCGRQGPGQSSRRVREQSGSSSTSIRRTAAHRKQAARRPYGLRHPPDADRFGGSVPGSNTEATTPRPSHAFPAGHRLKRWISRRGGRPLSRPVSGPGSGTRPVARRGSGTTSRRGAGRRRWSSDHRRSPLASAQVGAVVFDLPERFESPPSAVSEHLVHDGVTVARGQNTTVWVRICAWTRP